MSRCLSAPDATSLPTSLPQEQLTKTKMLSVVRIQQKECLVLCTVTSRLNVSMYCLSTTTSTNMPTDQEKKGTKKKYWSHTAQIREALKTEIKLKNVSKIKNRSACRDNYLQKGRKVGMSKLLPVYIKNKK